LREGHGVPGGEGGREGGKEGEPVEEGDVEADGGGGFLDVVAIEAGEGPGEEGGEEGKKEGVWGEEERLG